MMFVSQYLMDFKVLKMPFRSLQLYAAEKASEEKVEALYWERETTQGNSCEVAELEFRPNPSGLLTPGLVLFPPKHISTGFRRVAG